jgi:NAD-dependent dihydropyrimidine dehydrogenase PreA subunit
LCNWCTEHGHGKKWYLNLRNYSEKVIQEHPEIIEKFDRFFGMPGTETYSAMTKKYYEMLEAGGPKAVPKVRKMLEKKLKEAIGYYAQAITPGEAKKIVDIASPIARVSCACRRRYLADFKMKGCFYFGVSLDYMKEWPDYCRNGIEYISREEAKEIVDDYHKKGYVQSIHWFKPFISSICNCEYPYCDHIRRRVDYGDLYNFYFKKGHYIAKVNLDKCAGCKSCVSRCQFTAINYSPTIGKAIINARKCFGCGVCITVCPQNALSLESRDENPALKDVW